MCAKYKRQKHAEMTGNDPPLGRGTYDPRSPDIGRPIKGALAGEAVAWWAFLEDAARFDLYFGGFHVGGVERGDVVSGVERGDGGSVGGGERGDGGSVFGVGWGRGWVGAVFGAHTGVFRLVASGRETVVCRLLLHEGVILGVVEKGRRVLSHAVRAIDSSALEHRPTALSYDEHASLTRTHLYAPTRRVGLFVDDLCVGQLSADGLYLDALFAVDHVLARAVDAAGRAQGFVWIHDGRVLSERVLVDSI